MTIDVTKCQGCGTAIYESNGDFCDDCSEIAECEDMARLTEIAYTRRFNLGNYEHEEITLKFEMAQDEHLDPAKVIGEAQKTTIKNSILHKRKGQSDADRD